MLISNSMPIYQRGSLYGATLIASEFDDSQIIAWGPRGCTSQMLEAMQLQRQQFDYNHFPVSEAELLTNSLPTLKKNLIEKVEGHHFNGPMFFSSKMQLY